MDSLSFTFLAYFSWEVATVMLGKVQAGLTDVREKALVIEQAFTSFSDYWDPFLKGTGPGGAYVATLDVEPRQRLEARLRKRLLGSGADGSFALKARAWCVRGEVPGSR